MGVSHPVPAGRAMPAVAALAVVSISVLALTASPAAAATAPGAVPQGLRTGRVLLVRPNRIDVVLDGTVTRSVAHAGPLDLAQLPLLIGDPAYAVQRAGGAVRLGAVLSARPLTTVTGQAPALRLLELGDAGGVPARLLGTSSTLRLNGVTVSGQPRADRGPAVPGSLSYHTSTIQLVATTLSGLGNSAPGVAALPKGTPTPGSPPRTKGTSTPALRAQGGTVALTDSTVTGGGDGIAVIAPVALTLTRVRAQGTGGDGIRVRGGVVTVGAVTSTGNRRSGVVLVGPIRATLAGPLTVGGNGNAGLDLVKATGLQVSNVTSTGDHTGIRLAGVATTSLTRATTQDDDRGVVVEGGRDVKLTDVTTTRGGIGVSVKGSQGVVLTQITARGPKRAGIVLGADAATVLRSTVTAASDGLVLQPASRNVKILQSSFSGSRSALRDASAAGPVLVSGSRLDSAGGSALRVTGPEVTLEGCTLTGGRGITVRGQGRLRATKTTVDARDRALDIGRGVGTVTLAGAGLSSHNGTTVATSGQLLIMNDVQVTGGQVGVNAHGRLEGHGLRLSALGTGIHLTGPAQARLTDSTVTAGDLGIAASRSAAATLLNTRVQAPHPSRGKVAFLGPNRWSHEPMRWLGVGVLLALALGIALEVLRTVSDRRERRFGLAPAHVLNWR